MGKKSIRRHLKSDREAWLNEVTQEGQRSREDWEEVKVAGRGYEPSRDATKDDKGNFVDFKHRSEATKDHLEQIHWG